ncbi:MAG: phosphatase PAP2 family protein [Eubacteriales bacterium]|nr:phosphatase PAP2 family protein [Eubacteriales bacterium]
MSFNRIKEMINNNRHLAILFYYIVMWLGYNHLNQTTVPDIYLYHPIDSKIPFVKEMVVPYVVWYLYILVPLAYFAFKSPDDFKKLCMFMFTGMTISYLIFYLVPNGQNLRPIITETDIFSRIISSIYTTDHPTNSLPSMHVILSVAVNASICNSAIFDKCKKLKLFSILLCILICASTVFIKQHSILDVVAGLIVSSLLYSRIYSPHYSIKTVRELFIQI